MKRSHPNPPAPFPARGVVTATDSLCILRRLGGFAATQACPSLLSWPDVNGDGLTDATDALCVLRFLRSFAGTVACPVSAATL